MTNTPTITAFDVDDLIPYDLNPRDNEPAIMAVVASLRTFGFLVPIVVDAKNVIVAGHTRYAAVKYIIDNFPEEAEDFRSIPAVVAEGLDEDQLRAFRLVDNKTSELATWDFNLLAGEIAHLNDVGVPLVQFGWTEEEIDCLTSVVSLDCLSDTEAAAMMNDGIQPASGEGFHPTNADPATSVRISFGDLAFYVQVKDYTVWMNEMMKINEFDPRAVIEHVAENMGLLQAKLNRDEMVKSGSELPQSEEVGVAEMPGTELPN